MLEVYPIQEKSEQERICKRCGIKYDEEKMAYASYVEGELTGALQFAIHGKCGYIYDIENEIGTEDEDSLFVMGRGALNFINLCGINDAYYKGEVKNELLLKKIGFRLDEGGNWSMKLDGFFEHPCQHTNGD